MATRMERVLPLFVSAAKAAGETDRELLVRFSSGDETAFAVLVARHAKMVLDVCRRVLPTVQDAEDACQATFLVLSRKAAAGDWQASVANWLYGTARRIAARANRTTRRRAKREARQAPPDAPSALDQMTGREAFAALDAELDRLPPIYRAALVLCHLEGLTRDEAAVRLGVPLATLKSRLDRGRKRLADALAKRGVGLGAGLLAIAASSPAGASLPRLLDSILATVGGHPPESVAALATGVTVNNWTIKGLLAATAALVGFGLASMPTAAEQEKPAMKAEKKADPKAEVKPAAAKERTITGTVLGHDGKPLQAELALVWFEGKPQPLGQSNADGTFQVTVPMARGDYGGWLVAKAPGHGVDFLAHAVSYQPATRTPTAEVSLKLPKERPLKGRVIDQQGKPVAGAKVVASHIAAFDSDASRDGHFKTWAMEIYQRGGFPMGDRNMEFADGHPTKADKFLASPYTAISDADGRFEIAGLGSNHLVTLLIRGTGLADKHLNAQNRDGFDAAPINKMAKDHERKEYSFGGKWVLYGSDPTVVLEPEKLVRGRVMGPDGKGRVGVTVAFSRTNKHDLNPDYNVAVTDKDGKYEIRGARKHKGYGVEVGPDPVTGLLECQAFADDTVGYEPIVIDIKQAKGVVVTGRVTDKATGKPVACDMYAQVMVNNPFVDNYPSFMNSASMSNEVMKTDKDGKFRVVTIPGRVVLSAAPRKDNDRYRPAVPDPKHADSFHPSEGTLMYDAFGGGRGFVQGNSCQVVEAKPGDTEVTVNVELQPAAKTFVKVVDADGKPVTGAKATGVESLEFATATEVATDTLTVYNLESKAERLVAVRHEKRNLVGTVNLTAETKDPVVKLGAAGTVTGRAVDQDGKPLAGLSVEVRYDRRQVQEASGGIRDGSSISTDANGEFRVDGLFPGQEFRVFFHKVKTRYGPEYDKTPKRTVAMHGDTLKLGDLKLEPAKDGN